MKYRGLLITLEGIDGAGKSTQMRLLVHHLRTRGLRVRATREPGGTLIGERIRNIVLDSRHRHLAPLAELALMYAARAQHLEEVVRPALARGEVVLSDRYNDASFAYQGYGRKLGLPTVRALDRVICGRTQPDLTLVLDVDPRRALSRAQDRETQRKSRHSRFEAEGLKFQQRVRRGYLVLARQASRRVKVVNADRPVDAVQGDIRHIVDAFLLKKKAVGSRQ